MRHETEADRANELIAVTRWAESMPGLRVHRFPQLCRADYFAERDHALRAIVEVKCRTYRLDAFDTLYIDADKFLGLLDAAHGFGVSAVLVVECTDALVWADLTKVGPVKTVMAGYDDSTDPNDRNHPARHLVAEIPTAAFTEVLP